LTSSRVTDAFNSFIFFCGLFLLKIFHFKQFFALPESGPLPSVFYRALGKADFAERRTRQSPALDKELVYRV
jgi:hypothetical protein